MGQNLTFWYTLSLFRHFYAHFCRSYGFNHHNFPFVRDKKLWDSSRIGLTIYIGNSCISSNGSKPKEQKCGGFEFIYDIYMVFRGLFKDNILCIKSKLKNIYRTSPFNSFFVELFNSQLIH